MSAREHAFQEDHRRSWVFVGGVKDSRDNDEDGDKDVKLELAGDARSEVGAIGGKDDDEDEDDEDEDEDVEGELANDIFTEPPCGSEDWWQRR